MTQLEVRQTLTAPFSSDNGHFDFSFHFKDDKKGFVNITYKSTGEVKSYPFSISSNGDTNYVEIEYLLVRDNANVLHGIKKELSQMLHFLRYDVINIDHTFNSKERSLYLTTTLLSNGITSKNGNLKFLFTFSEPEKGTFRMLDTRNSVTTNGEFKLDFSEDLNKWFIDLTSDIRIKTSTSEFPLLGVYVEGLIEYIDKISN